jgi:hypothetical protein
LDSFFWTDPRLGGSPWARRISVFLIWRRIDRVRYPRCLIFKVGGRGVAWVWQRQLWVWEEKMLKECQDVLRDFLLHLFLSCNTFGSLWSLIRSWIGFSAIDSHNISEHFLQLTYSLDGRRGQRSFLQLICLLREWVVWNERNQSLFRNSAYSLTLMLDKVKLYSYCWLKTTNTTLVLDYHKWWSCLFTCPSLD